MYIHGKKHLIFLRNTLFIECKEKVMHN